VKIAALSASVLPEEREQVMAAGVDDFVIKPLEFSRIYECLSRLLDIRFVSVEPSTSTATESYHGLDCQALAGLPISLRQELAEALVSLDAARISGSMRRVSEVNPGLGCVLEHLAGQFRYTVILQALQSNCGDVFKKERAL